MKTGSTPPVLRANPWLRDTLAVRGRRAAKSFFHWDGEPERATMVIQRLELNGDIKPVQVGEWLAEGRKATIHGLNPDGAVLYRVINWVRPVRAERFTMPRGYVFAPTHNRIRLDYDPDACRSKHGISLDLGRLRNVRKVAKGTQAECPVCAEEGRDTAADNLLIYEDGRYGCAAHQGEAGGEHYKRIWELAGAPRRARLDYDPER